MKQATILQFVNDNRLTTSSRARLVSCPACDAEVALSKINAHLDEGCRPTDRWKPSPASEEEVRSGPKRSEEVRRELAATKERPRTSEAEVRRSPKRSEEVRRELAAIKERPSTSEGPMLAATSLGVQRTEPASEQRSPDWNAASQRRRRRRSRDDGRRSKRKKIEDSEPIAGSSDETRRGGAQAATSDSARRPSGCQGAPPSPRARENADGGFANGRGGASVANGVREEKETRKKRGALSRGVPRRRPADASGATDAVVAAATDPLRVGVAERNDLYRRRGLVNDHLVKFFEGTGHVPPAASDAKDTPDGASGLDVKDALDSANRFDVKDALDGASGLNAESVLVGEGAPGERDDDAAERVPYYLNNFVFVMKSVLSNAEDRSLLDDADMQVVENFFQLSDAAKQLYVRLFQRKHCWLPVSRLRYPLIAEDLCPVVDELASSGFLLTGDHLTDVRMVLELLSGPDVRSLAKDLRVMGNKSKKSDLTQCVLDYASKQLSIFGKSMHGVVLKKARKMLGACCLVDEKPRVTLLRLLLLFSLTMITLDDEDAGMGQLYSLLMVNMGKISYPSYAISRTAKIFPERDSLIRFQSILCMATELTKHLQNNAFESGLQVYLNAKEKFRESYMNESIVAYDVALPVWLRDFTANSIYTKLLYMGVELLQKMRDYKAAVQQLRELLGQSTYCPNARGRWWDRLALNLDQHLRKPGKALDAVIEGIRDSDVRTGHRLSLYLRAVKICKSLRNKKLEHRMEEVTPVPCQEPPKRVFQGTLFRTTTASGGKSSFITPQHHRGDGDDNGGHDMVMLGVEDLCIMRYRELGYTEGVHGEGLAFTSLLALLLWDVLYADGVADAFRGPHQPHPLDLRSDDFYLNRRRGIDDRLLAVAAATGEELGDDAERCWRKHEGEACSLINWQLFDGVDHVRSLLLCMNGEPLVRILGRLVKDHRHCRGGMPDLLLWNPEEKIFKLVEVKGPSDRLSHKQMLWLDFLLSVGVDAEVCHVEAVSAKKLVRPTTD